MLKGKIIMDDRVDNLLQRVKEILIEAFKPEQIILFGSRAKGTDKTGSDFDFAVKTQHRPNKDELIVLKNRIEEISGLYKIDIVFLSDVDEEFKQIILETGKVIYGQRS